MDNEPHWCGSLFISGFFQLLQLPITADNQEDPGADPRGDFSGVNAPDAEEAGQQEDGSNPHGQLHKA